MPQDWVSLRQIVASIGLQRDIGFVRNDKQPMLPKYKIQYSVPFNRHDQPHQYVTDDPVAGEEFLAELLERGFKINSILHEGVALPKVDSDKMIKTAAGMLVSKHLCRSLNIDTSEAHHRFGSPA